MRFLANENIPAVAVAALQAAGHDVVWVAVASPDSDDRQVLSQAAVEQRLILTFDKDFGELAFRSGLPAGSGVDPVPLFGRISRAVGATTGGRDLDPGPVAGHVLGGRGDSRSFSPSPCWFVTVRAAAS